MVLQLNHFQRWGEKVLIANRQAVGVHTQHNKQNIKKNTVQRRKKTRPYTNTIKKVPESRLANYSLKLIQLCTALCMENSLQQVVF